MTHPNIQPEPQIINLRDLIRPAPKRKSKRTKP